MLRKLFATLLTLCLVITFFSITTPAFAATRPSNAVDATFTSSKIYIDGKQVNFDAYLINSNNYLKLRDIAYALNGTAKQFNVTWDGSKNGIELIPTAPYEVVGGEMLQSSKVTYASPSKASVFVNTQQMPATAYLINGNNYFKLRDIGSMLNFSVEWDGKTQSVNIDTSKPYVEETQSATSDNSSGYLTVGEMSKYVIQSYLTNDNSTDYLHFAKLMILEGYFAEEDVAKYNDAADMSRLATRAELARVLTVYYVLSNDQTYFPEDVVNTFTDLSKSDEVTYFYCNAAVHYGLMTTPSNNKFNPTGNFT